MRKLFIIMITFSCLSQVAGQDRHYWSQMGGISAGLLGGSAIAGLKDNSSLYYNAAAMGFVNNPSISLGANTFRFRFTNIENGLGQDLNHFNQGFIIIPDLIGGLLFSKKDDKYRFGYAINTRFTTDKNFTGQNKSVIGDVTKIGDFDIKEKTQETWLNFANSYKFTNHLSLGLTFIVAIRSQFYSNYIGAKLIPKSPLNEVSRFDSRIEYNYWNVKGVARLSMALDYSKFRFGWTVTLPSLNLFGKGWSKREFAIVNYPDSQIEIPTDVIVTSNDEEIPTQHKYPFSSAFGASFMLNSSDWLHISSELFLPIQKYKVFNSKVEAIGFPKEAFDSISNTISPNDNFLDLSEQAKFIINFSVGYEKFISDNWGLLAGFRTDFNFNNAETFDLGEMKPYYSYFDTYYLSAGFWGVYKDQKITLGVEIGFSPDTSVRQFINFDGEDSESYPLLGDPNYSAVASQISFGLHFGIEIDFVKSNN
jgi:hypothetical protein